MTVNFNKPLISLEKKPFTDKAGNDINIGKVLANTFTGLSTKNWLKFFPWAQAMYDGADLTWDQSDLELFKKTLETTELTDLFKYRVHELLKDAENK